MEKTHCSTKDVYQFIIQSSPTVSRRPLPVAPNAIDIEAIRALLQEACLLHLCIAISYYLFTLVQVGAKMKEMQVGAVGILKPNES